MPAVSFDEQDWEEYYRIHKHLLAYAGLRIRAMTWMSYPGEVPPKLMSPEDIVSEALTKTLDGDRFWNKDKIDLKKHLAGVISSIISHHATNSENTLTVRIVEINEVDRFVSSDKSPEEKLINKDILHGILSFFEEEFKNDKKCLDALRFIISECESSPSALCRGLKITQLEARRIKQKIKRHLNKYIDTSEGKIFIPRKEARHD